MAANSGSTICLIAAPTRRRLDLQLVATPSDLKPMASEITRRLIVSRRLPKTGGFITLNLDYTIYDWYSTPRDGRMVLKYWWQHDG